MDANKINKLIKILEFEDKVYQEFIKYASKKTNVIIDGDINELQILTEKEGRFVNETVKLEEAREQIIKALAAEMGSGKNLTLQEIAMNLDEKQSKELLLVRDKLNKTIIQLEYKNKLNQKLISNSLQYVEFSLNLLTEAGVANNNYARSGQQNQASERRNYFDIKY